MDYLLITTLGVLVGFVLALPALILEGSRRKQGTPLMMDITIWRGRTLSENEGFAAALLVHLIISGLYGLGYVAVVESGWVNAFFEPYSLTSMTVAACVFWLILNVIVFPLAGFGWFGLREERSAWFETCVALLFESAMLWLLIEFFQPLYFMPPL